MDIVECPDLGCGNPAEIVDRWDFASTSGPMPHVKTRCLVGHVFTVPIEVVVEPLSLDQLLQQIREQDVPRTDRARRIRRDPPG